MIASPNDLVYFLELSNTLNFSRASERIGISQPSLSTAIKRLEESIGTQLFIRNSNGASLTQAGKRLLSHTKQLLQLWETIKSESLASHYEVQGNVSIGCHPSIALHVLSGFLPNLLATYPKLDIRLKHDLSRKILEGVINLSIDVGIVVNPIKHPDLILKKLYDDQVTFWCNNHLKMSPKMFEDTIIICDPELSQTQWLLKQLHKTGIKNYRTVTSSSLEVMANLTAHGCGIGILPTNVALAMQPNKLKVIPKMPSYNDEIYLAYRPENREIKALQAVIDSIKLHFKKS